MYACSPSASRRATPIPRTLSLTVFGDLDVSTIRGLPPGRRPIRTEVRDLAAADEVYVLNVSDGVFPSEFAAGKPEAIEEERRLLYVAMTRAKQSLSLVAPLRYHVTQQRRDGDKHVYGARSRFVSDALLDTMQRGFHGRGETGRHSPGSRSDKRIDVASRMREMW